MGFLSPHEIAVDPELASGSTEWMKNRMTSALGDVVADRLEIIHRRLPAFDLDS